MTFKPILTPDDLPKVGEPLPANVICRPAPIMELDEILDRQLRNLHDAFGLGAELRFAIDENGKWFCSFYGVESVEETLLVGVCGRGDTLMAAVFDYLRQLPGKRLRFGQGENRREILVVKL
jgi:hypothetical protein